MEYKLAEQVKNAHPTAIREIFMYACDHPEFLDLSIGEPDPDTFPLKEIAKASAEMYEKEGKKALAYGPYQGMDECIEQVEKWLLQRGFDLTNEAIEMLPGSGHGMDNMANTFCDEGDVILTEMFCYPGIQNAARMVGAKIVGVEMDDDGINLEDLDRKAAANPRAKFLYLCPSFNNPTGITIPDEKRRKIYEIAQKYDFMIYEDDPYSRLSFDGTFQTELKKLDTDGRVVYAASFSKIISSGMRTGFFVCNKDLRPYLEMSQGNAGVQSVPVMLTVANYLRENDVEAHCREVGKFYQKKAEWFCECADKYFPDGCSVIEPKGGLFAWVKVPESIDLDATWHELIQANVGVVPSFGFSADPENCPGSAFRVCYSTPSEEVIEEACRIMGDLLKKKLD
ncbi:MAG: PLP-dependent aminotransferase family protein [Anaerovoracaceae bacterium]|nr:PLP-dependent aminotransferase family protein [Anaerovoracaceae bacterium]